MFGTWYIHLSYLVESQKESRKRYDIRIMWRNYRHKFFPTDERLSKARPEDVLKRK
jgi:hypothetical protein